MADTAEEDLDRIRQHHAALNRERYLARLLASIQVAIEGICEFPEAWPEREPGIRKQVLRRYPYVLFYAVEQRRNVGDPRPYPCLQDGAACHKTTGTPA